jgi:predicted MPP superfamily phosphohydrolase
VSKVKHRVSILITALVLMLAGFAASAPPEQAGTFSFAVVGDMRRFAGPDYHTSKYFLGALEAIRATGPVAFMIIPGDLDPPHHVIEDITTTLGANLPVYVAVGNHDTGKAAYMTYIRGLNPGGSRLPNIVRSGPAGSQETMYAFEWGDAHVTVLNEYFDGSSDTGADGDVTDATLAWLSDDLGSVTKPFVFVVGHDPAYVFPDMASARVRHEGGGLEANPAHRDRFWKLLQDRHVTAYICGHTHNASARKVGGVWQLDNGHARGKGDKGAPSTFIRITVGDGNARYDYYRADAQGLNYTVTLSGSLLKD